MNLDSLTAALSHIGYLVNTINKKSLQLVAQELKEILQVFGEESEFHLYRSVLQQVEWSTPVDSKSPSLNTNESSNSSPSPCIESKEETPSPGSSVTLNFNSSAGSVFVSLLQQVTTFIPLHRFSNFLALAIASPINSKVIKPSWVSGIFKLFKFTKVQEVFILIHLVKSHKADIKSQAEDLLWQKLPDLFRGYIQAESESSEIGEFSTEVAHFLLTQISASEKDADGNPVVSAELREQFLSALQRDFPREQTPLAILPVLYPEADPVVEKITSDSFTNMAKYLMYNLADYMLEVGYGFCSSLEDCKSNLVNFGEQGITPTSVAKVVGMMVQTHTSLQPEPVTLPNLSDPSSLWGDAKEKTVGAPGRSQSGGSESSAAPGGPSSGSSSAFNWNVEVFCKALQEVAPSINVRAVTGKLDYKGFLVGDKKGFQLLVSILKCMMQEQGVRAEMFPVEWLYRVWKNPEEQLRLFEQILTNPEAFCLADCQCRLVVTEGLKALPELENKMVGNWKSLDLIELMLRLADGGHYSLVKELLNIPIQHCPDILILGLVQASIVYTPLRQELISSLIPIFLGSHPNGMSVLQNIWQTQKESTTVRQIVIMSMADWYMALENDQARLAKIFDVAQDLKALQLLLNAQPFVFAIDLACLAFRREYLNLEKWLNGKIRDHGEIFIISCVKFLQRRCPLLVGVKDDLLPKSTQLPQETVSTILACLQTCAVNLQQEYQDLILTMMQNLSLLNRPRQVGSLGFGSQSDSLGGIASSLSNLTRVASSTSSIFPPSSSSLSLGSLGALGTAGPSSPARPALPNLTSTSALSSAASQSSLSSLLPSLQLATAPPPAIGAVGSQLPSASSLLTSSLPGSALRSQSVQPGLAQSRQNEILAVDIAQIFKIPPIITKEVEDEANSYFQRIYNQPPHPTLSIEEILEMLKNFHESANKREREVYSCMLKNLFEEYRFFPTYPNRELILTARLFGGIIEQGLVEYIALGVALRYIVEALQKPHGSKMYYFGVVALDRFKARLKEYPRYCQRLMTIEHFNDFPAHLVEYIKYGTQSQEPPTRPSGPVLPASMNISPTTTVVVSSSAAVVGATTVSVGKSVSSTITTSTAIARPQIVPGSVKPTIATTNIETLLVATEKEEKLSPPADHVQDKIAFIFNNLSQINLQQKCEELKEIVTEENYPWVSQYLVMKRVSIENNFHTLYSLFLDQLNIRVLTNYVLQETLRNVKVLLRADKSEVNSSDKSLLKNLGHWLGMLTLAKNKPIFHIDIDIKSLVIEAYKKGLQEMQYVVPFVAKVLESCAKSRVFQPPNPWTMAIMNLMAELHREQDMKLHLKFEIEVLCNKLELNVKDLKPTGILKSSDRLSKLKPQLSQPLGKRADSTPLFSTLPGTSATPPVIPSVHSTTPTPIQAPPNVALETRFAYSDISLSSVRCFDAHVIVSTPQVGNLETSAQLKQLVRQAVDLAVQDIITAVIERSFKVAITTTEILIKKDFALEPDEARMRAATHHMVRNLTAAMAMITSKDHLATGIAKAIKAGILSGFNRKTTPQQTEQIDQLATSIAHENIGVACAFIQKTAAEKAVLEMDKRLAADYEARKVARAEGRRFCDARVFQYQMDVMPEPIRMKVGRVSPQQSAVYEEFARNIPGFVPIVEDDVPLNKPIPLSSAFGVATADDSSTFLLMAERITPELEHIVQTFTGLAPTSPLIPMLHSLLEGLLFYRSNRENSSAQLLVKRAVDNLLEGVRELPTEPELHQLALRFRDIHIIILKAMADQRAFGPTWTSKYVTKFWMENREEIRYNLEVMDWLLRSSLINVQMLDDHLQRILDEPSMNSTFAPLLFIMQLVQVYLIDDTSGSVLNDRDLNLTLESLIRLCQNRQAPDTLLNLIEALRIKYDVISGAASSDRLGSSSSSLASSLVTSIARVVGNNGNNNGFQASSNHHFHSGVSQARDFHDPQGLQEKTDGLLRDWIQLFHSPTAGQGSTAAFQHFVKNMDIHGILKTDEVITRFFRICISMCRDLCVRSISELGSSSPTYARNKCFPNVDAFVRLISLLVKQSGEPSNPNAKINLLNKVLGLICGIMIHDIETHGNDFQQLPYHRMLIMLFLELNAPEAVLENINAPVLVAFTQTLHLLKPSKCPGFAYAWLELVSHRVFIGRMLAITPQQKGWPMYSTLLTDLFKFLAPFLRNVELSKPFTMLYKGTLRVLLVLLHDFPEFLCEYHYDFCDVIPPNCIQMRNLILSAYPRNMRLPDPFMPNLKVDRLPEISVLPKISANVADLIEPLELKKNLDAYLKNRSNVNFLSELRSYLQVSNEPGMRYNMSLMNALVLYVGMQAIGQIQAKGLIPSMSTVAHTAHMDIFENLAVDLDTEGRYLFLIAIANQLRYPNSHTHYFSCTLLYVFSEANTEAIQEQITRVLLERLIGNRPQPWGLLITFIELIKNPSFKFWSHDFVKCAPEIEKIFESVARSCMAPKNSQPAERE